jgi:flavin reductase (DIM6/NTAB) family NADH-FMN oxidoreductase RutF
MRIGTEQLQDMDNRTRAAFVNCLSGFKSANLVGTVDGDGRTNLAIMSSTVHLGSSPPLLALIVRPGGDERHTLSNILSTGCYSINHVTASIVESAHQSAASYDRGVCEFQATGLTPLWRENFAAPLVAEAGIKLGLALREHQEMAINGTHLVIGEVVFAEIPPDSLRDDGSVDLASAGSMALSGLDTYCRAVAFKRMAYAKPGVPPKDLLS